MSEDREAFNEDGEAEQQARAVGWVPKDDFKGNPDRWKPAGEYLEYAEHMLPVLRSNNKELTNKLNSTQSQLSQLQQQVAEQNRVLAALKETAEDNEVTSLESKLESTRAALAEATRAQDYEAAAELAESLADTKAEIRARKAGEAAGREAAPVGPRFPPAAVDALNNWVSNNEWFSKDPMLAAAANVVTGQVVAEYRNAGKPIDYRAVLDEVTNRMDNRFNISKRPSGDKVAGDTGGTRPSTTDGKGYSNLPQAAKDACMAESKRKVGPGKAYNTVKDWQMRFAEIYWKQPGAM